MTGIDWKRKLTSRKFWAAIIGFVTALMMGFGMADTEISQVSSIIMAGATMISYIIGEGLVDANRDTTAQTGSDENESA